MRHNVTECHTTPHHTAPHRSVPHDVGRDRTKHDTTMINGPESKSEA